MATQFYSWWHRQASKLAYRRGCTYYQQTNYTRAIEAFSKVLLHYPAPADVLVMRGLCHWSLGSPNQAYEDFNQAIAVDPLCAKAYGKRGLLRQSLGDEVGALSDWRAALNCSPTYAEGYYHLALVEMKQENFEVALQEFDRAIMLRPDWPEAYSHRGDVKQKIGDIEGAVNDWQLAVCNDLSMTDARANLQAVSREENVPDYVVELQSFFDRRNLNAQIQVIGRDLKITLHREVGVGVNYFSLPEQIRHCLVPLDLPKVTKFSLLGYVGAVNQPEWSQSYELYQGQPCPPSHWQSVLSTLLMFPPCGATALIYAMQVKEFYKRGHYPDALRASKNVKSLCMAGAGVLCFMAMMPLGYTAFSSLRDEADPPQRTARVIDEMPEQRTLIE